MKKSENKSEEIELEEVVVEDKDKNGLNPENIDDSIENKKDGEEKCPEDVLLEDVLDDESDDKESDDKESDDKESDDKESDDLDDLDDEQRDYKKVADEYLLKLQRLQAEFDNFRKREEKQRFLLKDLITENVVQDILPVIDNFERATHASKDENTTMESFVEGINLVYQQFEGFLTDLNIERMDVLGETFDPEKHNAVSKASSEEYEEDLVSQVLQNGWIFNDKVIRHAMVVVSSGAATK